MRCVDGNVDGSTDDQGTVCAELCGPVTIDPRPKKNKQLAEEAAALWKLAKEMRGGKLWLAMVRAHGERRGGVRHEHNHAVDRLAADGADGRVLSRADLAAGARD